MEPEELLPRLQGSTVGLCFVPAEFTPSHPVSLLYILISWVDVNRGFSQKLCKMSYFMQLLWCAVWV